ncbi:adenylyltransferase/cytidyltransferase family protein [Actinomadura keratinilytica]|jgi:glycerol-3-phosphate cytidylyltransferase|uniref:Adenylyltransferase/cytidyltransferase family protein n=1 Tax=Actinomadura keratinilytica TaxID=547461 RepID=A0ABP7Y9E9_9ACTN
MREVIGFTPGVFDLFHVGHLDVLRRSARLCDRLVVGVWSDELAERVHGTRPVVPQLERMEIVGNVRGVHDVVPLERAALRPALDAVGFGVVFAGADASPDDAGGAAAAAERELAGTGVRVVSFPDVAETRSPVLRERIRMSRAGGAGAAPRTSVA